MTGRDAGRLVIVGELNPYGRDASMALYHLPRYASGNRLREHLGLSDQTYSELEKVNLCTGRWSLKEARSKVFDLEVSHDVVVMLGVKVRSAFASGDGVLKSLPPFTSVEGALHYVYLPHSSGLCRTWNDPTARQRARTVLTKVAPWVPWGEQG